MRLRTRTLASLTCLQLAGGCVNDVDKPAPPDMRRLIEAYESPSGELTSETIDEVELALRRQIVVLQGLCGWSAESVERLCSAPADCNVCGGLDPFSDAFRDLSVDSANSQIARQVRGLEGFVRVERVCSGTTPERSVDVDTNGKLQLVMGFSNEGFDPVFSGRAVDCRTMAQGQPVTVNAQVSFAVPRSFLLAELALQEPIVDVRAVVKTLAGEFALTGNVRLPAVGGLPASAASEQTLAFAFEVREVGTMVFLSGLSGSGIRASNGAFSCSLTEPDRLICEDTQTGERIE